MPFPSVIQERLEKFIEVQCIDSFVSHLRHIFLFEHDGKICGTFSDNKVHLWVSSSRIIGAMYPVVELKFVETHNKIILKSKMNSFGLFLAIIINVMLIWVVLKLLILNVDIHSDIIISRFVGFILLIGIFNSPIYMSYRIARNAIFEEVEKKLKASP